MFFFSANFFYVFIYKRILLSFWVLYIAVITQHLQDCARKYFSIKSYKPKHIWKALANQNWNRKQELFLYLIVWEMVCERREISSQKHLQDNAARLLMLSDTKSCESLLLRSECFRYLSQFEQAKESIIQAMHVANEAKMELVTEFFEYIKLASKRQDNQLDEDCCRRVDDALTVVLSDFREDFDYNWFNEQEMY